MDKNGVVHIMISNVCSSELLQPLAKLMMQRMAEARRKSSIRTMMAYVCKSTFVCTRFLRSIKLRIVRIRATMYISVKTLPTMHRDKL